MSNMKTFPTPESLAPQCLPTIPAMLRDSMTFSRMLELYDLNGAIQYNGLLSEIVHICETEVRRQFRGYNYVWVDLRSHPVGLATAVRLGRFLKDFGWQAIPCVEREEEPLSDLDERPVMLRLRPIDRRPIKMDPGLEAFVPYCEWSHWW